MTTPDSAACRAMDKPQKFARNPEQVELLRKFRNGFGPDYVEFRRPDGTVDTWHEDRFLELYSPAVEPAGVTLPTPDDLGRIVREAWVRWAKTQPEPKPHWLLPYDELDEPDKEADRQIGMAVVAAIVSDALKVAAAVIEEASRP